MEGRAYGLDYQLDEDTSDIHFIVGISTLTCKMYGHSMDMCICRLTRKK